MVSSSCVNQRAVVLSCGRHRQEPSAVFLFPKMSCFVTWSRFQCESSSGSIVPLISKRCLSYFLSCILLCCDLLPVSTSLSLSLSLSVSFCLTKASFSGRDRLLSSEWSWFTCERTCWAGWLFTAIKNPTTILAFERHHAHPPLFAHIR